MLPRPANTEHDAVVITPTIGEAALTDAVKSVATQSVRPRHLVVVDGREHLPLVEARLATCADTALVDLLVLPHPTGRGGFFGHRAIASGVFSAREQTILLLDADNSFEPDHVAGCLQAMDEGRATWCYALRAMVDEQGNHICYDDGESLGYWPRAMYFHARLGWHTPEEVAFLKRTPCLVDTSCYAVRRDAFISCIHHWDFGHGADALFAQALIDRFEGVCTGRHSVKYRLRMDKMQPMVEHIKLANDKMRVLYGSQLPWRVHGNEPYVAAPASVRIDERTSKQTR